MIPRTQEEITAERKDQARQSTLYILLVFFLGFASYTNLKKKEKEKNPRVIVETNKKNVCKTVKYMTLFSLPCPLPWE